MGSDPVELRAAVLSALVQRYGPIPCVRVSSAQASGRAKGYPYWGAVRYEIRLRKDGVLTAIATERASSDRRSQRLVERDRAELCVREGRLAWDGIGPLTEAEVARVLMCVRVEGSKLVVVTKE
jgi:hypothetical protein